MKRKFPVSYSKLYLVTEDVYNRLLHCISDKTEQEDIKKLNGLDMDDSSTIENNVTGEPLTQDDQKLETNLNESESSDRAKNLPYTPEVQQNDPEIENETIDNRQILSSNVETQTDNVYPKNVSTQTDNESNQIKEGNNRESQESFSLDKNVTSVSGRDLYNRSINKKKRKMSKYKCNICFKDLASNFLKKRHIRSQHKENAEKNSSKISLDPKPELKNIRITKSVKRKYTDDTVIPTKILKRQGNKRKNFEDLSDLSVKRSRLSQGVKRKSNQEDSSNVKRVRFRDWIPIN